LRLAALLLTVLLLPLPVSPGAAASAAPRAGEADIGALIQAAAAHRTGESLEAFRRLEALVRQAAAEPALRPELEQQLVQLLAPSASFEARRFACEQLGIIGGKASLPALARLLKEDETAGLACLALTTCPPGRADDILRGALKFATGSAPVQIINTLGDRRDPEAVPLLAQCAHNADARVAEAAVVALGKMGNAPARKALAKLRGEGLTGLEPALTEAALRCAEALARAGDRKRAIAAYEDLLNGAGPVHVRRAALAALLRLDEKGRRERILQTFHGMDSALNPVAIAALATLPPGTSSEPFVNERHRLAPREQAWMIESLAAHPDVHAMLAITMSVTSPESEVRLAAIEALSRIGDPAFVPLLARALGAAKTPAETRAIQSALVALRGGSKTDDIISTEIKHSGGETRARLIGALVRRAGPAANPLFFAETDSPDPVVAKAAFRALGRTASREDVPALLETVAGLKDADLRSEAESAATQALSKVGKLSTRSVLVRGALGQAKTPDGRASLLRLLPGCADAESLAALKDAGSDPEARVRDAALHALADWPGPAAWDILLPIYRQPETESARELALRGLVRLAAEQNARADPVQVGRYRQLLASARTDADRKAVLGALGGLAQAEALQLVVPLLRDPAVRAEAEAAFRRITAALKAQALVQVPPVAPAAPAAPAPPVSPPTTNAPLASLPVPRAPSLPPTAPPTTNAPRASLPATNALPVSPPTTNPPPASLPVPRAPSLPPTAPPATNAPPTLPPTTNALPTSPTPAATNAPPASLPATNALPVSPPATNAPPASLPVPKAPSLPPTAPPTTNAPPASLPATNALPVSPAATNPPPASLPVPKAPSLPPTAPPTTNAPPASLPATNAAPASLPAAKKPFAPPGAPSASNVAPARPASPPVTRKPPGLAASSPATNTPSTRPALPPAPKKPSPPPTSPPATNAPGISPPRTNSPPASPPRTHAPSVAPGLSSPANAPPVSPPATNTPPASPPATNAPGPPPPGGTRD
jgi:HEAT repeat protein